MGNFSDLPSEIMLDIFTRLPTESVLDCKSVSKTWRNVLHHQSFNQMHSNLLLSNLDSSGKFSFVFKMDDLSEQLSKKSLYYLEYDDQISSHKVLKLNLNPPFELYGIVGSCNGLICVNGLPNHYSIDESTTASYVAYICNPITREVVTLPELDRSTYYDVVGFMLCGFGYVASTNEYKVVRLYTFRLFTPQREQHKYAQIEVYTLGSGKGWRNVGNIKTDSHSIARRHLVFANGFLFWNFENGRIVAFDLAEEVFVESDEFWKGNCWHRVLGGHICCTHYGEDCKSSDVFLLKKKEDESFRWNKEFSLINTDSYTTSLALTGSGTVVCYSNMKLYLYDLKSSSSKMLEDFGGEIYNVVSHINTFVSLKVLGEENKKTLESDACEIEEEKGRA